MRQFITCPRCDSDELYFLEVNVVVDYNRLVWNDGKAINCEASWDREYYSYTGEDPGQGLHDGALVCQNTDCMAEWPDLDAFRAEINKKPAEIEECWVEFMYTTF